MVNLTVSHINMVEEWENKYHSDYEKWLCYLCRLCKMIFVLMLKNKKQQRSESVAYRTVSDRLRWLLLQIDRNKGWLIVYRGQQEWVLQLQQVTSIHELLMLVAIKWLNKTTEVVGDMKHHHTFGSRLWLQIILTLTSLENRSIYCNVYKI